MTGPRRETESREHGKCRVRADIQGSLLATKADVGVAEHGHGGKDKASGEGSVRMLVCLFVEPTTTRKVERLDMESKALRYGVFLCDIHANPVPCNRGTPRSISAGDQRGNKNRHTKMKGFLPKAQLRADPPFSRGAKKRHFSSELLLLVGSRSFALKKEERARSVLRDGHKNETETEWHAVELGNYDLVFQGAEEGLRGGGGRRNLPHRKPRRSLFSLCARKNSIANTQFIHTRCSFFAEASPLPSPTTPFPPQPGLK